VLLGSDEPVYREQESGATVLRTAPSHLRFGHFEYFAWSGQGEKIPALIDYALRYHFPTDRWRRAVCRSGAPHRALIAKWQAAASATG
jgi:uncharacterized protein YdiU (UPF0061 family)